VAKAHWTPHTLKSSAIGVGCPALRPHIERTYLAATQEDLAYEAEVNRTYMSKIEKGATWVGLEIIGKIAVLEVEPAELLRLPARRPRRKQAMK
jgi:transcriptional regulator with XRE-family HTH domain